MAPTHRDAGFWNRLAARYARAPVADQAAYERKLELTRAWLTPASQVLEFGCGTGSTALRHAPHVRHVTATDISARMLAIARDKARAQGVGNVEFREAALDDIDAPGDGFDAVLGMSVLHLLRDRGAAIARVHRLLKPGGVFVSSTVCIGDAPPAMRIVARLAAIGRPFGLLPVLRSFTGDDLRAGIRAAGFEIVEDWRPAPGKALFLVARKPAR